MLFLTIEDLSGMLDVIVFPDEYQRTKNIVSSNSPMLITGTIEADRDRDKPFLKAEKVGLLTPFIRLRLLWQHSSLEFFGS